MAFSISGWVPSVPCGGLLPMLAIGVRSPRLTTGCDTPAPLHKSRRDPHSCSLVAQRLGIVPGTELDGLKFRVFFYWNTHTCVVLARCPRLPPLSGRHTEGVANHSGRGTHAARVPTGRIRIKCAGWASTSTAAGVILERAQWEEDRDILRGEHGG